MTLGSGRKSSQKKVKPHRSRSRGQGLRPIQFCVPDVRTASFRKKAHRQPARRDRERLTMCLLPKTGGTYIWHTELNRPKPLPP